MPIIPVAPKQREYFFAGNSRCAATPAAKKKYFNMSNQKYCYICTVINQWLHED